MVKRGQANIIAIILIVLIILVAVVIVWNIFGPLIKQKSRDIGIGGFTIDIEIKNVVLFENGVLMVNINRGSGNEELDGLRFIFYDEAGNSLTGEGRAISELETRTYSFSAIPEIGKIIKVGVAPVINGKLGRVVESEPESILKVPSGVVSWWRFDDLNDFIGGNTCEVLEGGINNGVLNGKISCSANGLPSGEDLAISFWVKGNANQIILAKGDSNKISIEGNKLRFDFVVNNGLSDEILNEGWNHIVISLSSAFSKVYVNKVVKIFSPDYFEPNSENLIINGEVDEVMIFDKPITNIEGIYNIQKKD